MRRTATRIEGGPDWNSHQRGAWIALWLWQGARLSDVDIARLCGMSRQGAIKVMEILAAALPIVKVAGKWQWMSKD